MTELSVSRSDCVLRSGAQLALVWLTGVLAISASGLLADTGFPQRLLMPGLIVLPVAVFALAWKSSPDFRNWMTGIDTGLLVILHSWRMVGLGFLFLYAHDVLPGLFAWLAGVGDMVAAFGALLIGSALLRGRPVPRSTLLAWNSFGLLDFVIAVSVGTALRSSYFGGAVSTDAMAQLPLSLVPTVIVPLYVITHLVIFLQQRERNASRVNQRDEHTRARLHGEGETGNRSRSWPGPCRRYESMDGLGRAKQEARAESNARSNCRETQGTQRISGSRQGAKKSQRDTARS